MNASETEECAMRSRFVELIHEWGLGPADVRALLQDKGECLGGHYVSAKASASVECRMRLLLAIRSELSTLGPSADGDGAWLREEVNFSVLDLDCEPLPNTPLAFMSGPIVNLRAMRDVLRERRLGNIFASAGLTGMRRKWTEGS